MVKCVLGVESTAHTFGVAVVGMDGEILSNVKDSYTTEGGGMIPLEVRRHHASVSGDIYEKALSEAGVDESEIEAVAFSNAPGLAPCLLEGMEFVKKVAKRLGIPVVCVNHCVAHLEIGKLGVRDKVLGVRKKGATDPVMLYASGANTQVIAYEAGKYRVFGETLDLGVGNFIDTVGRMMKLGFPAGPKIEKLALEYIEKLKKEQDEQDEKDLVPGLIDLPYSVKGMDVAFAGMQTKIRNLIERGGSHATYSSNRELLKSSILSEQDKGRVAYSMQEVVFAMLVEVAERALAHTGKSELLLGGGVACNARLVEMCRVMCEERGARLFVPEKSLLVDNGAMIGYLGLKMWRAAQKTEDRRQNTGVFWDLDKVDIAPRERTDDVVCDWWR